MRIVEQCSGMNGALSAHNKLLLKAMLQGADAKVWRLARRIVICRLPPLTLGMVISRVTAHRDYREEVPDPFTTYRALRYSLQKKELFQQHPDVCDTES